MTTGQQCAVQFALAKWLLKNRTNALVPDLCAQIEENQEYLNSLFPDHVSDRTVDSSKLSFSEFTELSVSTPADDDTILLRHVASVDDAEALGVMWCDFVALKQINRERVDALEFCLSTFLTLPETRQQVIIVPAKITMRDIQVCCTKRNKCYHCGQYDIEARCGKCGYKTCLVCNQRICVLCKSVTTVESLQDVRLSDAIHAQLQDEGIAAVLKPALQKHGTLSDLELQGAIDREFYIIDNEIDYGVDG